LMPTILFQSNRFVVIDKPPNWLSVPSRLGVNEPRPCAGIWLQETLGGQVFPVHRLDFGASGLLVYALDRDAHRISNGWFADTVIHKQYQAITTRIGSVCQIEPGVEQTWESRLSKGKKRAYADLVRGKNCRTEAVLTNDSDGIQTWLLSPATGRPHQLRWELAHHGFPIVGDELYGSEVKWRENGIALRLVKLRFPAVYALGDGALPKAIETSPFHEFAGLGSV
jgi:tRNA pseudouridine32 synthase / 23S rRNA pseudouridine746 synthase